jgi:hypothetical protein
MRHLRVETEEEFNLLRRALDRVATGQPVGGNRDEAAGMADRLLMRLDAAPDVPAMHEAMRHVREALGLCEARVRDLTGTTRDGTRGCGATLTPDGVCPAATLHV